MTTGVESVRIAQPEDVPDLDRVDAWWCAANYLSAGQIYLLDNPLLREPLRPEHVKSRLVGHWGSVPGVTFTYAHLNRVIARDRQEMLFVLGPGHAAAALNAAAWLEGTYSEMWPDVSQDLDGIRKLFRQFAFPGGVPGYASAHVPGSIHEGGELGYSLAHATGAALDNPDLIVACMIGDGEAETGPLATSWNAPAFLDPAHDGAVLPILHLNGYKSANPTVLARIPQQQLKAMLEGYGWDPVEVVGIDPAQAHEAYARALDRAVSRIHEIQQSARRGFGSQHGRWPMIILRTPKGWTGPRSVDGLRVEGSWRSHQVPLTDVRTEPTHLAQLEKWLRSYRPEELFDNAGAPVAALHDVPSRGRLRMSANRSAHGHEQRSLRLPEVGEYAVEVEHPGQRRIESTRILGAYLRDTMALNKASRNLAYFAPDEDAVSVLGSVFEVTDHRWRNNIRASDDHLATDGRVFEVLSQHLCQGWLEGYVRTGRHGLFATREAFAPVVDSMVAQHAKWLQTAADIPWREPMPSVNYLVTEHVWSQYRTGTAHQEPSFIDHVLSSGPEVSRVYFPPDANTLLHVMGRCLRSRGLVNVVVAGDKPALQYLDDAAAREHCEQGLGVWSWGSTDVDRAPDVVLACAGDVPTQETLAAVHVLRGLVPDLSIRVVNVVDLARLFAPEVHPHGITDRAYVEIFGDGVPVIFAFHGYPWLIHRVIDKRPGHDRVHVHGFRENAATTTPFDMCAINEIDRYHLALAALEQVPAVAGRLGQLRQILLDRLAANNSHSRATGEDLPAITNWSWPNPTSQKEHQ